MPVLAPAGFQVGEYVEELGIGWTFEEPYRESLMEFFSSLTYTEYEEVRRRIASLAPGLFAYGGDYRNMLEEAHIELPESHPGAPPARDAGGSAVEPQGNDGNSSHDSVRMEEQR